ncbi:putative 2-oxoglutarate-dependent dioxygenase AOP1.2 [Capsicum baccatum]|uniref:2-oxoglutarate-dependent dioxygenase AOP1.2 n=1 Tax=Capsicum baccatum TaxID=33114 RepID=A0A2G2VAV6_CAPBA|nr:putative 2-oxoglutarate-dependent dioxygenase AOP1.2 [Capsicum baccatum]
MGSENIKLPSIDFSHEDLKPGTPVWNQVKSKVHKALVEYGCFEESFDKIPIHLRNSIFEFSQEVFNLPLETKVRNVSTKPFYGYVGHFPKVPLYESMGIDDANIPHEVEKFTQILWPQGNPTFCKTTQSYSEQLVELDQIVKGLQVLTKDGQWINVDATPNTFTVIIGDSLHAWTNGRLHSSYHRVMMTGNEARYSVGLFSLPKAGYTIKAPEELVDDEHPLLFKPFDHLKFLAFCYSKEGMRWEFPLKTYCGV